MSIVEVAYVVFAIIASLTCIKGFWWDKRDRKKGKISDEAKAVYALVERLDVIIHILKNRGA